MTTVRYGQCYRWAHSTWGPSMAEMTLDELQHLLWTFAQHRVVTVAGRTGVLRRLAASAASPEQVAGDLSLDPNATGKLVRALHALGMVRTEGDAYRVVDGLAMHFAEGPNDIAPFFDHSHSMYEGWGRYLEPWLRGEPWGTSERDPERTRRFGTAMRALGAQIAKRAASRLDTTGDSRMLDVGGGFGQYSMALCAENPDLEATVLDTPEVAEFARLELDGTPFEDRISFIGGDYLSTDYRNDYDLVLIANILHQENPARAAELVRRAAEALGPGGRVAVVDFQIDDRQREQLLGVLFAINMRSFGDTHTEPRIRGWMTDAGLEDITRTDIDRDRWLIVGRKLG